MKNVLALVYSAFTLLAFAAPGSVPTLPGSLTYVMPRPPQGDLAYVMPRAPQGDLAYVMPRAPQGDLAYVMPRPPHGEDGLS